MKLTDEQILEIVQDSKVDDEIKQVDIFKEKAQKAIIDAATTIEKKENSPWYPGYTEW